MAKGLTAQRIWQELTEEHRFSFGYASAKRFVRRADWYPDIPKM